MSTDHAAIGTAVRAFAESTPTPDHLEERIIVAARARNASLAAAPGRSRTVWLSLAAAAVVVAVALLLGVLNSGGHHDSAPPAVSLIPTTAPPPSPSPSPSPTIKPAGPENVVTVGGATLHLPAGWAARQVPSATTTWCLLRSGQTALPTDAITGCSATIQKIPAGSAGVRMSVDTTGGTISNPNWCGQVLASSVTWRLLDNRDKVFGGRAADYRRWTITCPQRTWHIEQYVVDTAPAYILFSAQADGQIHRALAAIAAKSALPHASGSLRYSDLGRVTTVTQDGNGYHVTLNRVVDDQGLGKYVTIKGATEHYLVAERAIDTPNSIAGVPEGSVVELATNGSSVTYLRVLENGPDTVLLGEPWLPGQQGFGSVMPSHVFNGGDPSGDFTIAWDSWGGPTASGHGMALWIAPGSHVVDGTREPASFRAYNIGTCLGHRVYLHLAVWFPQHGQTFVPGTDEARYTLCPQR